MWSFVGSKSQQRWLWHAIDHHTGQVLAYVFGTREDEAFLELKALLKPFGITCFYTDGWGAYRRHLDPDKHTVGKQHTQKIERKHTTLRARIKRLVRKTICFSHIPPDLVVRSPIPPNVLENRQGSPYWYHERQRAYDQGGPHAKTRQTTPRKPYHHHRFPERGDLLSPARRRQSVSRMCAGFPPGHWFSAHTQGDLS